MSTNWNTTPLRRNVKTLYGRKVEIQLGLSLESVLSRFAHGAYHIDEFTRLVEKAVDGRQGYELVAELLGRPEERLMPIKEQAEAHAIAAVQALHSIADILGTMIVTALQGELNWSKYLRDVPRALTPRETEVARLINTFLDHDSYRLLDALANQAKHRNIVEASLMVSLDEVAPTRGEFIPFHRKGTNYGPVEIVPFLNGEYARQAEITMAVFRELDRLAAIRSA